MFDAPLPIRSLTDDAAAAAAALWAGADGFDIHGADLDAMMRPLRDAGLFVACLPASEGGSGLATETAQAAELEAVLRRIGGGSLSAGRLFEGHVNAVKLIYLYGDGPTADGFASDVRGGAVSGVWNAEPPCGLTLAGPPSAQSLRGQKLYCSGAGWLQRPLMTAHTEQGLLLVAPRNLAKATIDLAAWRASGMRATATGLVTLNGAAVLMDEVVGAPGDYLKSPHFKGGAWRFCAVQLGGAERLFSLLLQRLEAKGRGADPYQRARVGRAALVVETARLWVASARQAAEIPSSDVYADTYVNLARSAVEAACAELLQLVARGIGLEANMGGSPIERVSRDLATYLRQPFPDGALDEAAGVRLRNSRASPHEAWR